MFTLPRIAFFTVTDADPEHPRTEVTPDYTNLTGLTLSEQLNALEKHLNSFSSQLQNSRIAGDLLKAFGDFFTHFQQVDEATRIYPIFDQSALQQIQNATPVGHPISFKSEYVLQSGATTAIPITTASYQIDENLADTAAHDDPKAAAENILKSYTGLAVDAIVNTYLEHVDPASLISLTRLVTIAAPSSSWLVTPGTQKTGVALRFTAIGTEVIGNPAYLEAINPAVGFSMIRPRPFSHIGSDYYPVNIDYVSTLSEVWAMDDYAPRMVICAHGAAAPSETIYDVHALFDFANWATVNQPTLSTYHQLAAMSLCATPDMIREQSNFQFV